jgi:Lantibiotic dehydratase, N terminus
MTPKYGKSLEESTTSKPVLAVKSKAGQRELLHHPYVVLRIAGLPFSMAQRLVTGEARRLLNCLQEAKNSAAQWTQKACDVLQEGVSLKGIDQDQRHIFLKARRNLYNGRLSGLAKQPQLLSVLGDSGASAIHRADAALEEVLKLQVDFASTFAVENAEARSRLRALCMENEDFLKGVAFSSPSLIADLIRSVTEPDKDVGKRARNLDMALFNYFIRATIKVSPLTYFTPVLSGRWSDEYDARFTLDERKVVSSVEVSRRALSHIVAALSRNLKFWGESHPLAINPTVEIDGSHLQFRGIWGEGPTNGRTWGLHQPLARLPVNERILGLVNFYQISGQGAAFNLRELYAALGQQASFALPPAEFVAFAAKAVYAGLLVPVIDLCDQEDWMAYLCSQLGKRAPEAATSLNALRDELARYSEADYDSRLEQSIKVDSVFEELCAKVGTAPFPDNKTPLFYEDCYLDGEAPTVPVDTLGDALSDLQRLSELFPLLDFNHITQSGTAGLFRQRSGGRKVMNASECAQSIADEAQAIAVRMAPLPLAQQEIEIAQYSENASMLVRGKRLFFAAIFDLMASGEDVVLDDAFIDTFTEMIPEQVLRRPTSYTVIGQTNNRFPGEHFILNRLYSGHSMLMSRFLRGQDEAGIAQVSQYLNRLADGARMVEIPGVFGFNANLHPRFTDAELGMPGRLPNYRDTSKIPLSELRMRYDAELDRVMFLSPEDEELSVHYFGFLNLMALTNIYQLLGRMNLQGLILDLWQDLYFLGKIAPGSITLLPRVTYHNTVLSRRSLFIPVEKLPSLDLSDADFFRGLHDLLYGLGETRDHYTRLIATRDDLFADDIDGRGNIAVSTDFKPAYLSFEVPLTVSSLKRRLQRRKRGILLQEALPEMGKGGVEWNGSTHACEYQFEVSRTRNR